MYGKNKKNALQMSTFQLFLPPKPLSTCSTSKTPFNLFCLQNHFQLVLPPKPLSTCSASKTTFNLFCFQNQGNRMSWFFLWSYQVKWSLWTGGHYAVTWHSFPQNCQNAKNCSSYKVRLLEQLLDTYGFCFLLCNWDLFVKPVLCHKL